MNKAEVLQRFVLTRQALYAAVEGLSESEIVQVPVEGVWTAKDLLAHAASWERATLIPLRAYAQGGAFDVSHMPDHLAWNDQEYARWRDQSLQDILADLAATRQEFLAIAETLPEERWEEVLPAPWGGNGTLLQMVAGLAWHENEHIKSLVKCFRPARLRNAAVARFKQGFNCAQSVLAAYTEDTGIELQTALKIATAFGGGMSRLGLTCGAVSGALMVIGLRYGMTEAADKAAKERTYALGQEFVRQFTAQHGSITCNSLIQSDISTPKGRQKAHDTGAFDTLCPALVGDAVEILERLLAQSEAA